MRVSRFGMGSGLVIAALVGCGGSGGAGTGSGGGATTGTTGSGGSGGEATTTGTGGGGQGGAGGQGGGSGGGGGMTSGAACIACGDNVFVADATCKAALDACKADVANNGCLSAYTCRENCLKVDPPDPACFGPCDQVGGSTKDYPTVRSCICDACKVECAVACQ